MNQPTLLLSPLRFGFDAAELRLPVRLGLLNAESKQDLLVYVLSPDSRYEVANYPNVTIPTNLDVKDETKTQFGAFYAALFDRTVEKNPGGVGMAVRTRIAGAAPAHGDECAAGTGTEAGPSRAPARAMQHQIGVCSTAPLNSTGPVGPPSGADGAAMRRITALGRAGGGGGAAGAASSATAGPSSSCRSARPPRRHPISSSDRSPSSSPSSWPSHRRPSDRT